MQNDLLANEYQRVQALKNISYQMEQKVQNFQLDKRKKIKNRYQKNLIAGVTIYLQKR